MGARKESLEKHLTDFQLQEDGKKGDRSKVDILNIQGNKFNVYINSFWTSKQRQASSLHEVSYRACFKPQLPRFFMGLLSGNTDTILDPFSGRGTTVVEAGLMGRNFISNDINPLSSILSRPRFHPPTYQEVERRLDDLDLSTLKDDPKIDLSMFYHPDTIKTLFSLRSYLVERKKDGDEDDLDRWIRMVATNRLTGHSKGFFSVYTLPPNQAVSPKRQIKINERLGQTPDHRDLRKLILKKTKSLLRNLDQVQIDQLNKAGEKGKFLEQPANKMTGVQDEEVSMTITSPPFLNIVQYSQDNWLRCWFNDIDAQDIEKKITMSTTVSAWAREMASVFSEIFRVTKKGGHLAFEVGEIRNKKIMLDEIVIPIGLEAGFECIGVVINEQDFTKTSNIWGVSNNTRGTNTNRVALFRK